MISAQLFHYFDHLFKLFVDHVLQQGEPSNQATLPSTVRSLSHGYRLARALRVPDQADSCGILWLDTQFTDFKQFRQLSACLFFYFVTA